jgi:predicted alpha/beta-fold hydrolase
MEAKVVQGLVTLTNGGMLASASGATPRTKAPAGGSESDGHFSTFKSALRAAFARGKVRESERLSFNISDPMLGFVKLTGFYRVREGSDTLVLILHGLASCAESLQCSEAADGSYAVGCSSLRLSMRGADFSGEDIYHAGLSEDIRTVLANPMLAHYRRVILVGYSFGGNLAIRAAIDRVDDRISAVAAVCPPLDLEAVMNAGDEPRKALYKRAIVAGLNRSYAAVEARGRSVTPLRVVEQAKNCSDWNEAAIVPRFGFRDVKEYYDRTSVIPELHRLNVPCLVVAAAHDPIVPASLIRSALAHAGSKVSIRWSVQGGHLSFPAQLDLGTGGKPGLQHQMYHWLLSR